MKNKLKINKRYMFLILLIALSIIPAISAVDEQLAIFIAGDGEMTMSDIGDNELNNFFSSSLPTIINYILTPRVVITGNNVTMALNATDVTGITRKYAIIRLPDNSKSTINLAANYTTTTNGRYNVTFIANNTLNFKTNITNTFVAGPRTVINISTKNSTADQVQSNLTIYYGNIVVYSNQSLTSFSSVVPGLEYDLLFSTYSGKIRTRLNGVNISRHYNDTLLIDKLAVPTAGYLVTYALNNTFGMENGTITIYYSGLSYSNENNLDLYKCANWNFTGKYCLGTFALQTPTQNTTGDYFKLNVTSFSGFAIKETTPAAGGPGGGGGSGGGRGSSDTGITPRCETSWYCDLWTKCIEGKRERLCQDLWGCVPDKIEKQSCTITAEGVEEAVPGQPITERPAAIISYVPSKISIMLGKLKGRIINKTTMLIMSIIVAGLLIFAGIRFVVLKHRRRHHGKDEAAQHKHHMLSTLKDAYKK